MPYTKIFCFFLFLTCALTFSCQSQESKKKHKKEHKEKKAAMANSERSHATAGSAFDCNTAWKYVYNPDRLKIKKQCTTVTGIIRESNADDDGDQHMLLQLDSGQEGLLTARNTKKKEGFLVIEVVCANDPKLKKVGTTCQGYLNGIAIPALGTHVKVTGSYVIDSHNGWAEIHPVTKIEML